MILGQPLQNPLHPPSEIDSEPFTMAMERQQAKHKTRCQVWKEEVENLLIFVSPQMLNPDLISHMISVHSLVCSRRL